MKLEKDKLVIQLGTILNKESIFVEVTKDGPYVLHGKAPIVQQFIVANSAGISVAYQEGKEFTTEDSGIYLCRCGWSENKPYCDSSRLKAAENGVALTEAATFNPEFATAGIIDGPVVSGSDVEKLWAFARFCDNGQRIWN